MKNINFFALVIGAFSIVAGIGCAKQAFDVPKDKASFSGGAKYNPKVDVLWVIDTSSSMGKHQQNIAAQAAPFLNNLKSLKLDFHLAATTMDMSGTGEQGHLVGSTKVITNQTSNMLGAFQNMVLQGENGSNLERGLESMKSLMEREKTASSNHFLRKDALLVVIFITDEDDFSAGTPQDYIDYLNVERPPLDTGERSWLVQFIGVTEPNNSECTTRNSFSDPGDRYMALATASTGISTTICTDDFTDALTHVKARIVQFLTDFHLDSIPVVETIKVYINGVLIAKDPVNGWSYLADRNVVRFNGTSAPSADDQIDIKFTPSTQ
jgi:hypothetical protein